MKVNLNWKWLAFGGIGLLLLLSSDAVRTYREKKKLYQELTKKLDESKRLNQKLAREVERLKSDPQMIGEIARRELGLLHPKEIEYRFIVRKSSQN